MDHEQAVEKNLADRLGMHLDDFLKVFGAAWRPARWDGPARVMADEGTDGLPRTGQWFVAGDLAQLLLYLDFDGATLARPVGRWEGAHGLYFQAVDEAPLSGDASGDRLLVQRLLKARRAAFRYCAYCRHLTPPEYRSGDLCMTCQTTWHGVVF